MYRDGRRGRKPDLRPRLGNGAEQAGGTFRSASGGQRFRRCRRNSRDADIDALGDYDTCVRGTNRGNTATLTGHA